MVVLRPCQADRAEKGPKKMSDKIKKEREEDEIRSEQSEFQQMFNNKIAVLNSALQTY